MSSNDQLQSSIIPLSIPTYNSPNIPAYLPYFTSNFPGGFKIYLTLNLGNLLL
ncbi:hypothetical protein HanXRQr2_Chr09g0395891 [Helianthus annuus]|uniref:Uncharacterized protein n=1 Tax=Helianthus annuus TaxID=4232 RepID=A0A9K3I810_HELAN|nr:hypothetical protein HanXRQr2_Chr09g0395891 [Helianthus annuus]KAJ0893784.1 hypothetical protein HanPSC8_Chr09g0381701 [Helianthus annuus]